MRFADLIDLNGPRPHDDLTVSLSGTQPNPFARTAYYQRRYEYWEQRRKSGDIFSETNRSNGNCIALAGWVDDDDLTFDVRRTTYLHMRAATDWVRGCMSHPQRRSVIKRISRNQHDPRGLINNFPVGGTVLTSDGQIMLLKRSEQLVENPGCWTAAVTEISTVEDARDGRVSSILKRGVAEELGVEVPRSAIRWLSVRIAPERLGVAVRGCVDLRGRGPEYEAERFENAWHDAETAWEVEDVQGVPVDDQKQLQGYDLTTNGRCLLRQTLTTYAPYYHPGKRL